MTSNIEINCLIRGDTPASKKIFTVVAEPEMNISLFKQVIYARKKVRFQNIDADYLKLWKVDIPQDDTAIANLLLAEDDKLKQTVKIKELWPQIPDSNKIHVIIKGPLPSSISDEYLADLPLLKGIYIPRGIPDSAKRYIAEKSESTFILFNESALNDIFFYTCLERGDFDDKERWHPDSVVLIGQEKGHQERKIFGPFDNVDEAHAKRWQMNLSFSTTRPVYSDKMREIRVSEVRDVLGLGRF